MKLLTSNVLCLIYRKTDVHYKCYPILRKYMHKVSIKNYPERIFSGIQPTGSMHIGNYLGTIQKWVELQNSGADVIWSIVDLHSITLPQDPKKLKEDIMRMTATLIACGIEPEKSILFQQSTVPLHAGLCWIIGCVTTMARLGHLPQFKEKSKEVKDVPLGLYIYPVLQAADILLYRATKVPVGQDQLQHIYLTQDLAEIFNKKFGITFPIPQAIVNEGLSQRIKSLRDPTKKMSKSDIDAKSRLELTDEPNVLFNKIKKAVTDCTSEVTYDPIARPGVANLITIHSLLTGKTPDEICKEAEGLDTGKYKLVVAEVVIEKLKPVNENIQRLMKEHQYLEEILRAGSEKATNIALSCWSDVTTKVGFGSGSLMINNMSRNINRI